MPASYLNVGGKSIGPSENPSKASPSRCCAASWKRRVKEESGLTRRAAVTKTDLIERLQGSELCMLDERLYFVARKI